MRIPVVEVTIEAFCATCGLLVGHEVIRGKYWPVEHRAPECGGWCVTGGVSRAEYHLGSEVHRIDCLRCDEEYISW